MNGQELLKLFVAKENSSNLYTYKIWNKSIYSVLRPYIRREFLVYSDINPMSLKKPKLKKTLLFNIFISFTQLVKLFFSRKKIKNIIFSFPRVELVNNLYIDKFTDPLIELTNLKFNSIVLESSVGGMHKKPRIHNDILVHRDFIDFTAISISKLTYWILPIFYKKTFNSFYSALETIFPYSENQKKRDYENFISFCVRVSIYKFLFNRLGVKQVFGVSRVNLNPQIYAAKEKKIPFYEFQHGITYGESSIYSGEVLEMHTPDYFLSFGEIKNKNVYGIDPDRIINIGWAFSQFVSSLNINNPMSEFDVLVITEHQITDKVCKILDNFAKLFHNHKFHLRLHPQEEISQQNLSLISQHENIVLQNNKINSNVVISWFKYVIGENSTVLYEAVSIGKKVGCLEMGGLEPKFLNAEDRDAFYIINNIEEFGTFLNSSNHKKNNASIYSEFKGDQFDFFK